MPVRKSDQKLALMTEDGFMVRVGGKTSRVGRGADDEERLGERPMNVKPDQK